MKSGEFKTHSIQAFNNDAIELYMDWPIPTLIISDGPYGVGGFPGDPPTPDTLKEWYRPHIHLWTERSSPQTSLWFWGTEVGWANVHPVLDEYGWEYRACCIWDKGISHIAGNSNTKSLRMLPVVTEVCVHYMKQVFIEIEGRNMSLKDWLRFEWKRTGLPLKKANEAAGVKNAATRKYLTKDHLWYFPPPDAFEGLVEYSNRYGNPEGRPYFSVDGNRPLTGDEWEGYRAKFSCPIGVTNVWNQPPLNGSERVKVGTKALHLNQKPINLMELIISMSTDPGDVVWEPFGGLGSAAIASHNLSRTCYVSEINEEVYKSMETRIENHTRMLRLPLE